MTELSELFALDPLNHTTETLDEIITKYRGMRSQFSLENNKKAGKTVKPKVEKPSVLAASGIKLNLGSILR